MEEISRASGSVALSYGAHSNLCINQLVKLSHLFFHILSLHQVSPETVFFPERHRCEVLDVDAGGLAFRKVRNGNLEQKRKFLPKVGSF